jgi:glycosyltransferase involved in cell wall biosynthesis
MDARTDKGKVRILHIIASPGIGGAERLLLALAGALNRQRFELVIAMFVGVDLKRDVLWNEAKNLPVVLEPVTIRSSFDWRQLWALYSIVRRHRPHVIHTHGYKTNILGLLFARLCGAAIISTVHGWLHADRKITLFLDRLNRCCLKHFSRVIAVSHEIRSGLEQSGIPPHRIEVLKNIPTLAETGIGDRKTLKRRLGLSADAPIIGFVGRLEKVKGISQFVQAALDLLAMGRDVHFLVIGDGSERAAMEEMTRASGAGARFHFLGFLSDPGDAFRSLDIYVLSSLSEGIPLTLLEAMHMEIPVIATAVGGVPEVINNGENGLLVPPDDVTALTVAMDGLLESGPERDRMVAEAKRNVQEQYALGRWINRIETIYLSLTPSPDFAEAKPVSGC